MEEIKSLEEQLKGVSDVIHLRGCIEMSLLGPNKEIVDYRKIDNTVVTAGRSWVLSRIMSQSPSTDTIKYIAIGTSTTAPATGNTALVSEPLRITISTFVTDGLTNNPPSWQAQATFATDQAIQLAHLLVTVGKKILSVLTWMLECKQGASKRQLCAA